MHNLLTEPVIPILLGPTATRSVSLPDLYVRLGRDSVHSFSGLAAHQAPAWYQFLVQLGALALHHGHRAEFPERAEEWLGLLTNLAPDHAATAWSLVESDPGKPALLQPPTARISDYKPYAPTPDALDVLVKAKNFDRKQSQAVDGPAHLWLYSLVNLQTTQGYSGRGQPGIARMNGGLSSRPLVDLRPGARWGPRVVRGIRMLLAQRAKVLRSVADGVYRSRGGLSLTWVRGWDDDTMLSLGELDPYFIEVCRRLRLVPTETNGIAAVARPAMKSRTDAKAFLGNLGDPWVPVNIGKSPPAALTVGAGGFDYRLAQRILLRSKEFRRPLALDLLSEERGRNVELHLAALVRGQGKTEGFHERVIALPAEVALDFGTPGDAGDSGDDWSLAHLSERMVDLAGSARKVLRQAILVFLQGPENPSFKKPDAGPLLSRFDRRVDEAFFEHLFKAPDRGWETAETGWQGFLKQSASASAEEAWESLSPPAARREKARVAAEGVLFGGLRKSLPNAFSETATKEQ